MPRSVALGALALVALVALSGCTGPGSDAPSPSATASAPVPAPSPPDDGAGAPEPEPEPEPDPVFMPEGTADDNAPFVQFVISERAAAEGARLSSEAIAQTLIDAGFAPDTIEVTADRTPLGNATDVVSFAVRVGDACILGELRGVEALTQTAAVLGTGRCLVGADVSIG